MMTAPQILTCDAVELASMIASGQLSPVEVMQTTLEHLKAIEPSLNAFSHVMWDSALQEARRCEATALRGNPLPPLFGVPVSVKDLIAVAGAPLTFGSKVFAGHVVNEDGPAVARLRAAGAIVIGKTTTSEMGGKAVGASPLTGYTRSPWDTSNTAGGSSAGAAASVAAGVTPIALGTDGGGSIRIPAALNGLIGFKAQFGRIPVYPHSATPDLAHVAPIARSARDTALLLEILAGPDPRDPASLWQDPSRFLKYKPKDRTLRIAWSPTFGYANPDPEVVAVCEAAIDAFVQLGYEVDLVEQPVGEDPADIWTHLFYAQVGARYGERLQTQAEQIDPALLALVHTETRRSALTFANAQAKRRKLHDRICQLFERYDVLVSPTLPVASVQVGQDVPETLADRNLVTWASYTYPFNLTGHPAVSLPAGLTTCGHPVGLQLVGKPLGEARLLAMCEDFEAARPWPKLAPNCPSPSRLR